MKSLVNIIAVFVMLIIVTGCKELDKVAELDEIERLLERMETASTWNPLGNDSTLSDVANTVIYDSITIDSLHKNTMLAVIKKWRLEGHDYWIIVGVGEKMGGTGITHSESCWCKRFTTTGSVNR